MKPTRTGNLGKKGDTVRNYRKRYFELHDSTLYYFSKDGDRKPSGSVYMVGATVKSYISDRKKRYIIQLRGGSLKKTYKLEAENVKDWLDWSNDLKVAASCSIEDRPMRAEKISLDSFDIERGIGRGYFATVLLIDDRLTSKKFALKIVNKTVFNDKVEIKRSILCDLDHPFIVKLQHAFQTRDKLYLVMDLLSGGEIMFHLTALGKQGVAFSHERARFYAAEIVLAFEYLHGKDIAYRDLRSENVMINKEGHICLTEFGLGRTQKASSEDCNYMFVGTPEYFAPEVLRGEPHDGKSADWYSFGILLYEMLVGLPPFLSATESPAEILDMIKQGPSFPSSVRKDARSLITALLKDDDSRLVDIVAIKKHVFFADIDWDSLLARNVRPPWLPDHESKYLEKLDWILLGEAGDKATDADDVAGFEYNLY
jgi:serine/threonine protein kinase